MDSLRTLHRQIRIYIFFSILLISTLVLAAGWLLLNYTSLSPGISLAILGSFSIVLAILFALRITAYVSQPFNDVRQAIAHVSPGAGLAPAPNFDRIHLGHELVTNLCRQIYELASLSGVNTKKTTTDDSLAASAAIALPIPLLVIDKDQIIRFANEACLQYLQKPAQDVLEKNMYPLLDLSFQTEDTLDSWLEICQASKATDTSSWDRVRLKLTDNDASRQFDMAATYSKGSSSGAETVITFFDHTAKYAQDDQGLGFVALAVHELRTPLTLLRGYIEVFEDEFAGKLDPELTGFMSKMSASAQSLAGFVNNILNVMRVEENQLTLNLTEESWAELVQGAGDDMRLRAQVHGKTIEYELSPDLPTVGVDRVSIYEVLYNLLDNAIKYSGDSQKIIIRSTVNSSGQVETSVQDFGVGIPTSILPNLFDKFYRNHRSRAQIGGTGLGLYLSKAIISAHDGHIWVQSKEGEGSTFSFSLLPYAQLAAELKTNGNTAIVRGAQGWIKNHSMYRR